MYVVTQFSIPFHRTESFHLFWQLKAKASVGKMYPVQFLDSPILHSRVKNNGWTLLWIWLRKFIHRQMYVFLLDLHILYLGTLECSVSINTVKEVCASSLNLHTLLHWTESGFETRSFIESATLFCIVLLEYLNKPVFEANIMSWLLFLLLLSTFYNLPHVLQPTPASSGVDCNKATHCIWHHRIRAVIFLQRFELVHFVVNKWGCFVYNFEHSS